MRKVYGKLGKNTIVIQTALAPIILDIPLEVALENLADAKQVTGDAIRKAVNMTMLKMDFNVDYELQIDENYLTLTANAKFADLSEADLEDILRALAFYKFILMEVR